MTLDELDAAIDAHPNPGAVLLWPDSWIATMRNPQASAYQLPADGGGFYYRGLRVWVTYVGVDRMIDANEAERERLG